ncbi:RagB/SusD family nutrient uptake outer membrane protein [Natronoflexus pectinivorans]|uniref:Putative outer membrane starch-binding protein n=1 Tax=Natronoflexus pectinivorans TaxID=682526 RepID=A0A4R2GR85_9BACT|nr:RagB/SusD family nutrient uptake outer membrane protein [Natronoflexus pectinivorans]TCO10636.1 putative outer membrane starch-binding protein [Natronoflexus pectinivorans]
MKKVILSITIISILSGFALTSCEDAFGDFLDKQPSNELTEEQVFSNWTNTRYYYHDIYNFLRNGRGRINNSWMDATTDLATTSYSWGGARSSFNIGNYYAGSGAPELISTWEHYYRAIRKCNTLLERIESVPMTDDQTVAQRLAQVRRMKAEARTLRAYFYWELALRYGAVPIITERLDPKDESINDIPRPSSVSANFQFILNELEASRDSLDNEMTMSAENYGRFTQGANLALQSRIKLYLASPRFANLNLVSWEEAAEAAEKFIELFGNGTYYRLHTHADPVTAYMQAITTRKQDLNPEVIFWRNDGQSDWLRSESPVGFGGDGGLSPSQNLVDMYDMANGYSPFLSYDATGAPVYNNGAPSINEASGYSDDDPYTGRDARFYATVLHHGAMWWNRPIDVSEGGADNPRGSSTASPTGYYNRKYMDDSRTHPITGGTMWRNWIFIRYAEILLNYAEAMNEAYGPVDEVFDALQQVRDRAGLTADLRDRSDLNDQESMRNFIRKERTVELAFEDHRAWDVRRWNVAVEALARPIYGMTIQVVGEELHFSRRVAQERVFEPRMYLYPIPEAEIWKTGMENNPGW